LLKGGAIANYGDLTVTYANFISNSAPNKFGQGVGVGVNLLFQFVLFFPPQELELTMPIPHPFYSAPLHENGDINYIARDFANINYIARDFATSITLRVTLPGLIAHGHRLACSDFELLRKLLAMQFCCRNAGRNRFGRNISPGIIRNLMAFFCGAFFVVFRARHFPRCCASKMHRVGLSTILVGMSLLAIPLHSKATR
jgi:hypothetical protein